MGKLILVRHGNSVWNQKNIFTGWVDVSLSKKGIIEASDAGKILAKVKFDAIFTSTLSRAIMTLQLMMLENEDLRTLIISHGEEKKFLHGVDMSTSIIAECAEALNERYYGDMQGKNKDEVKEELGEQKFKEIRRSFLTPPPNGESLKMTIERALPYFHEKILPKVRRNETVLVVAHGNSLRGIVKEVKKISDEDIAGVEIATGSPLIFAFENGCFKEGKI